MLSDQIPELIQAVRQAVGQPKYDPELLNPVPGNEKQSWLITQKVQLISEDVSHTDLIR